MDKYTLIRYVHIGLVGYVKFVIPTHPITHQTLILCEILDMKPGQIEIVAVSGDRTCFWIKSDTIYKRDIESCG